MRHWCIYVLDTCDSDASVVYRTRFEFDLSFGTAAHANADFGPRRPPKLENCSAANAADLRQLHNYMYLYSGDGGAGAAQLHSHDAHPWSVTKCAPNRISTRTGSILTEIEAEIDGAHCIELPHVWDSLDRLGAVGTR